MIVFSALLTNGSLQHISYRLKVVCLNAADNRPKGSQLFVSCLVLTSCASQHTTRTRSCTRCWNWPSVRAARGSACFDLHLRPRRSPRTGGQCCTVQGRVALIHLQSAVRILTAETQTLDAISPRKRRSHKSNNRTWVFCYCMYIKCLTLCLKIKPYNVRFELD